MNQTGGMQGPYGLNSETILRIITNDDEKLLHRISTPVLTVSTLNPTLT